MAQRIRHPMNLNSRCDLRSPTSWTVVIDHLENVEVIKDQVVLTSFFQNPSVLVSSRPIGLVQRNKRVQEVKPEIHCTSEIGHEFVDEVTTPSQVHKVTIKNPLRGHEFTVKPGVTINIQSLSSRYNPRLSVDGALDHTELAEEVSLEVTPVTSRKHHAKRPTVLWIEEHDIFKKIKHSPAMVQLTKFTERASPKLPRH